MNDTKIPTPVFGPQIYPIKEVVVPKDKPNFVRRRIGATALVLMLAAGGGAGLHFLTEGNSPANQPLTQPVLEGGHNNTGTDLELTVGKNGGLDADIEAVSAAEGHPLDLSNQQDNAELNSAQENLVADDQIPDNGNDVQPGQKFSATATEPIVHPDALGANVREVK